MQQQRGRVRLCTKTAKLGCATLVGAKKRMLEGRDYCIDEQTKGS